MVQNSGKVVIESGQSNQSTNEDWETDVKPLVFRKERKYAIPEVGINVVENYVRSHPAMFSS